MRGLVLSGANCTTDIWEPWEKEFRGELVFAEYPHDITQAACSVSDISSWIYSRYQSEQFQFLIGHSMGGIVALELVSKFGFCCSKTIFIESNLKPAKEFYRNLMTPANMDRYGAEILKMIKSEAVFYSQSLKKSVQEDFDFTDYVINAKSALYGIYGDRGVKNYGNRISDLCLDANIADKIKFYFIENSCHMPMVENPKQLSEIVQKILSA